MSRLQELMQEIRELEERVATEISREAKEFGYTIRNGRIAFSNELLEQHGAASKRIRHYLSECSWIALAVAPVVYSLIIPVVLFDIFIWFYQTICFPIYRLPKVRRSEYIAIDRQHLQYLNLLSGFLPDQKHLLNINNLSKVKRSNQQMIKYLLPHYQ